MTFRIRSPVFEWQISGVIASYYLFLTTFLRADLHNLTRTYRRFRRNIRHLFRLDHAIGGTRVKEVQRSSTTNLNSILRWFSCGLSALALAASVGLLIGDVGIGTLPRLSAAVASAAPLLLVGTSFLFVQPILRPRLIELLKNVLLAATFLLWGTIQLMPRTATSIRLGNVVIALYVLDLAWVTLGTAISREKN